jgi:hypothetical protein
MASTARADSVVAQLTDDSVQDGFGVIADGAVYWTRQTKNLARWNGGDTFEIFFESDPSAQSVQHLSASGNKVVWRTFISGGSKYYFYDGDSIRIVADGVENVTAILTDGSSTVLYATSSPSPANHTSIFLWNSDTSQTTTVTTTGSVKFSLGYSAGRVIWKELIAPVQYGLFLWNGGSTRELRGPEQTHTDRAAAIAGDYVAWFGNGTPATDRKIWLHRISSGTTQLLDNGDIYQQILVSNTGSILFYDNRANVEIWPLGAAAPTTLGVGCMGHIDGNRAVWTGGVAGGTNREVLHYDVATGQTTRITTSTWNNHAPYISGSEIVWQGRPGNNDAFIYVDESRLEPIIIPEFFRRGDANGDENTDISDAVLILSVLFTGQGEL